MELFLGTILSIILRLCFHRYKVFIVQAHLFSPSQTELQNKVILVTGAGDGIGRQAALSFAKHGAEVILLGKTVKKLEAVYDEIVAAGYIEPGIIPLDMQGATEKHYVDMGAMLIDQYGRLDGILHNASILGHLCPFNQITSTEFNDVMQVNVTAQFYDDSRGATSITKIRTWQYHFYYLSQ